MPENRITVVIVSYNVRSFLNHCLQSVFRACEGFCVKVIVVDNASKDDSADMVRERYPNVTLITNSENVGFGRANNQAFAQAEGDAILILNPDAFIQEDTLRILWSKLQSDPTIGAIGPKILLPNGTFEPRSMRGFPTPWASFSYLTGLSTLFPKSHFFSRYLLTYLDPDQSHDVDALMGCCIMVRRDLIDGLAGFDPDYFMYGEDLDLCYRIRLKGYRIVYDPTTRIIHFKGESTRRSDVDYQYHFQHAMRLFVEKNLKDEVPALTRKLVNLGFALHAAERKIIKIFTKIAFPIIDLALLNLFIYSGRFVRFPDGVFNSDVLIVNAFYSLFYCLTGVYFRIYGDRKLSASLSVYAATTAGLASAALTYFFMQWAFSRFVVLWFTFGMIIAMPGWRIVLKKYLSRKQATLGWGMVKTRRALIIGTDDLGRSIGERLKNTPSSEFEPVGFVNTTEDNVGDVISGIPVLGWVGEINQLIAVEQIQELIFSTAAVSYESIIGIIQSINNRRLNFKIVPNLNQGGEEITLLRMEVSSLPAFQSSSRGIIFKK
jgi:O-antigen biosynthesis protein